MAHFFFPTWLGDQQLADEAGLELDSPTEARGLAARGLGDMARDVLNTAPGPVRLGVDILDGDGAVLMRLRLVFTIEPGP